MVCALQPPIANLLTITHLNKSVTYTKSIFKNKKTRTSRLESHDKQDKIGGNFWPKYLLIEFNPIYAFAFFRL